MASSNYREIGEAIAAEVAAVEGAGRVHAYQRWAADLGRYLALFRAEAAGGGDEIRGWLLTREKAREEPVSFGAAPGGGFVPLGVSRRVHTFLLFGLMSAEDEAASELRFQDLVEAVCDRFRDNDVLRLRAPGGAPRVATLERLLPPQVDQIALRAFGGVLCHTAEVRIQAVERIARS